MDSNINQVMKICVFQGTFNPIHNAHLRAAKYIFDKLKPDKFLFIPACIPPRKDYDSKMTIHRLEMVKLALSEYPEFEPSDIEYRRSGKSYTYNTIIELYKMFPNLKKVYFLIGTDAFRKIETWYNTEELKKLVKFIVFIREEKFNPSELNYLKDKGYDFEIQKLPFKDISSTKIRELLKNRKGNVKSDIPEKVMEYIEKNGLYNS